MLPNPVTRYCTQELKIRVAKKYVLREMGWGSWTNVIGLRADEPMRVARATASNKDRRERFDNVAPVAEAHHTIRDITAFWAEQPFDLRLPNINGKTPLGNCDLCFLKGAATIGGIIRERPDLAKWWADMETTKAWDGSAGHVFRSDRPSYAKMIEVACKQGDFFSRFPDHDTTSCMCHD